MTGREQLPVKEGMLHRKRLDELLTLGLQSPFLTVIAGPGYGKTQAVAQWARFLPRRLLWLRLSRLDNNRDRFFMRFVRAAGAEFPALAQQLEKIGFPGSAQEYDALRGALNDELKSGSEAVFVLDDYESITECAVREFVRAIIAARLKRLCVVIVSSQRADYNASGLKNGGMVFPVTAYDLKFNAEETQALFRFYGIPMEEAAHKELLSETDGWPLALYMLAQHCRGRQDGPVNVGNFLPVATELFEYEYYLRYDPVIQLLLVKLAAFPFFTFDIVRDICGGDLSGIIHVVGHNCFIEYDHHEECFVFQKVYRNFLQQKQALLDAQERTRVYRIGGGWMMRARRFYEAVICFFSAEAYEEMMDAILEIPRSDRSVAFSEFVLQYLESIPESYRVEHASVDLAKAYHYMNVGEHMHARALLLEILSPEKGKARIRQDLLGEVYLALGDACLLCSDLAFCEHYRQAHRLLPHGSRIKHAQICFIAGRSIFLPDSCPGRLDTTVQAIIQVWPYVDAISGGSGHGFEYMYAAQAAYMVCDMGKAEELCYRAIFKGAEHTQHAIICDALFHLMRIAVCNGDYLRCEEHLRSMRKQVNGAESHSLRDTLQLVENWYAIKMGNLQRTARSACEDSLESRRPRGRLAMWHILCCVQYLMATQQYHEALARLLHLKKLCGSGPEWWAARLFAHITEAVCRLRLKQKQEAVQALWEAYRLTHHNHIYAPFMEMGSAMRALAEAARRQQALQFDEAWLDTIVQKCSVYAKRMGMVTEAYRKAHNIPPAKGIQLSRREEDVLQLLKQGLNREEIALACGITVHGVKKHITGIYNKLGAANRAEAIYIASENGILTH